MATPKLYRSNDLTTWEDAGALPEGTWRVIAGHGLLLAASFPIYSNTLYYSVDNGTTWIPSSLQITISQGESSPFALDFVNGRFFFAASIHDVNLFIAYSDNGIDWITTEIENFSYFVEIVFIFFKGSYYAIGTKSWGETSNFILKFEGETWVPVVFNDLPESTFFYQSTSFTHYKDDLYVCSDTYIFIITVTRTWDEELEQVVITNDAYYSTDTLTWVKFIPLSGDIHQQDVMSVFHLDSKFYINCYSQFDGSTYQKICEDNLITTDHDDTHTVIAGQIVSYDDLYYSIDYSSWFGGNYFWFNPNWIYHNDVIGIGISWQSNSTGIPETVQLTNLIDARI